MLEQDPNLNDLTCVMHTAIWRVTRIFMKGILNWPGLVGYFSADNQL